MLEKMEMMTAIRGGALDHWVDRWVRFEDNGDFDHEDLVKVLKEVYRNLDGDGCSMTVLMDLRREY